MPKSPSNNRAKKTPRLYTLAERKTWYIRDAYDLRYVRNEGLDEYAPQWTYTDWQRAQRQGWYLSMYEPYARSLVTREDEEAVAHVQQWAESDPTCRKALALITARKLRG